MTVLSRSPPRSCLLAVFAKHSQPGKVKTRLVPTIGAEKAAEVHQALLAATLARLQGLAASCELVFTPPHEEAAFRAIAGDWRLRPQAPGDLGQRMRAFFDGILQIGERVVLVGSDSPDLPRNFINEAFAALAEHDVVLGPA